MKPGSLTATSTSLRYHLQRVHQHYAPIGYESFDKRGAQTRGN